MNVLNIKDFKMEIKVLGTGNAFNQQSRMNSSFFIHSGDQNILIDCGFTVPLALHNENIDPSSIDMIFITHYHGDHYAGLSSLLLSLKYIYKQQKPLKICGPGDVKSKIKELLSVLYNGNESLLDELAIDFFSVPSEGGLLTIGELEVEVYKMIHSLKALPVGYVLNLNEFKIGFSGDTCWHSGVEQFLSDCDKAIIECSFSEKIGEGHISVDELEASAKIQQKKKDIYLTHLYSESSKKAKDFGYNVLEDGDRLNFKS